MTVLGRRALMTNDAGIAQGVRHLATQARQPAVQYERTEIGYHYRMSNLLAASGRAQLSRRDDLIDNQWQHHLAYHTVSADLLGVEIFQRPDGAEGASTVDNPRYVYGASERLFAQEVSPPSGSAVTYEQFGRVVDVLTDLLEQRA